MKLTEENKKYIDSLPYEHLLETWLFAPADDLLESLFFLL
jgi:hypothetical protein